MLLGCTSIKDGDIITQAKKATSVWPCGDFEYIYFTDDGDTFCSDQTFKVNDTIRISVTPKENKDEK